MRKIVNKRIEQAFVHLSNFGLLRSSLLLTCFVLSFVSCCSEKKASSIEFKKLGLTCIHSDKNHVVFKGKTTINGVIFQVLNEVNYDEIGEHIKLIQGKDTLSVYLDETYDKTFIYDVNEDSEVDLNFIYKMTNHSYVNYSFSYDIPSKKYNQIPDTIYYQDLTFFEK
ncbi:MAG: hypothetical protein RL293_2080 [Bacteroidota bacterium]